MRTYIEASNRRNVDLLVEVAVPDTEAYPFAEWPGDPIYEGKDGLRALVSEWTENFDEVRWDTERLLEVNDQVLALIVHRGRIKGTGVPLSLPMSMLCGDFRDEGKIGKLQFFLTWAEGLEAVGLSE